MFNNNLIGILALMVTIALGYLFLRWWQSKIWNKRNLAKNKPTILENKLFLSALIIISFLLLFYLDFLRAYIFENLTYRMNYVDVISKGGSTNKYLDPTDSFILSIIKNLSAIQIYYLKFFFTIAMILIYLSVTQLILTLIYRSYRTMAFSTLLYGLGALSMMFVFSLYFFTFPYTIKNNFYLIAMEIGHFLESSLPTLLLILSFKIYLSSQNVNQIE